MATGRRTYEDYDWRPHYDENFAGTGKGWAEVEPGYRYGFDLFDRFEGRDWNDIEADARADWEEQYPDYDWNTYRSAVRYGYGRPRAGTDFEQHYEETYSGTGKGWAEFEPAYQHGYNTASSERYHDRQWEDIEPEVQKAWAERYGDAGWEDNRGAIMYGYERGQLDYAGTGKGWAQGYDETD